MSKAPLSYLIQLASGLLALLCIPMIFIAEVTDWFGDELFHLPQWIAVAICFISGIVLQVRKGVSLGRFHRIISVLGTVLSGVFLILLALVIWMLIGPDVLNSIKYRQFDRRIWMQSEESVARTYMADDLIRDKTLDGLTKAEVIGLLGEPFERDPMDGSTYPAGAYSSDIHYLLGPERGAFAIDSEWLMIKFGEDGKVSRYWLYTD